MERPPRKGFKSPKRGAFPVPKEVLAAAVPYRPRQSSADSSGHLETQSGDAADVAGAEPNLGTANHKVSKRRTQSKNGDTR